jgi:hypothetical protein
MPPRKPPTATETYAVVLGGEPYQVDARPPDEAALTGETYTVDFSPLDIAEATQLAVIRERVRNGTSDFQDARWLLGIVDKLLA